MILTAVLSRPLIPSRTLRRRGGVSSSVQGGVSTATKIVYKQIEKRTAPGIALFDITPQIRELIEEEQITNGFVNVLSRHTTTALTINENEPRLMDDTRAFLKYFTIPPLLCDNFNRNLAPADAFYLHNDLHLREAPEGWPGGWEAWAEQEPENAHSHLLSMVLGNSETIPIHKGQLMIGQWQSVLLVELDGPRLRTVGLQVVGH